VLKVSDVNKLIVPVSENNKIKYYVHLSIVHAGWNRMEHEVNTKYKNITRDIIMLYLNSCESCKRKGSTAKKGLVVQ
jgi:hypothetical protein